MVAAASMWSYAWGSLSFVLYFIFLKEGNKENVLRKKEKEKYLKIGK
jgi:hypothetical protein